MSARRSRALTLADFAARLGSRDGIALLVLRLPEIERVAWHAGRGAARRLERRALDVFTRSAATVLRADDVLGHEPASNVFAAALCGSARGDRVEPYPDARAAVARIGAAVSMTLGLPVDSGWTRWRIDRDGPALEPVFARALEHGARERERYAFFSLLGHELRTPLAAIRGYLETLLDDRIEGDARRRFTGVAYRESVRLSRLVDGLFEISLLDLHDDTPSPAYALLAPVFDSVRDATASAARAADARVVFAPVEPVEVAIDADRCILILTNLVSNAIAHGRAHGCVRVGATIAAHGVRIDVDDDGPGVPRADRERIFALGARGRSAAPGSGIGLALVRMLVERAGGQIEVDAAPTGGARFAVVLPRYRGAAAPPSAVGPASRMCGVMKKSTSSFV